MKNIPVFICKKCEHILYIENKKLNKIVDYDCPNCGEEGYELWIFSKLATKKEMDKIFK